MSVSARTATRRMVEKPSGVILNRSDGMIVDQPLTIKEGSTYDHNSHTLLRRMRVRRDSLPIHN